MIDWLHENGLEAAGLIASLVYLFYSIREKVWLWPWGILASLLSLWVFYSSRLYADMGLQFYYLSISAYGWWYWMRRSDRGDESKVDVAIKKLRALLLVKLFVVGALLYGTILYALLCVPAMLDIASSDMPYLDALTTAASIVATWMLARKYIDHWLFWIAIDLLSMFMYLYKGLYFYSILFLVYTIGAVVGYLEWQKALKKI